MRNEITTNENKVYETTTINIKGFGNVRAILHDIPKPLICGLDAAKVLGYIDEPQAISTHCHDPLKLRVMAPYGDTGDMRPREMYFLTRPDFSRLVIGSKMPNAQAFEKLVFEEILESVYDTGQYVSPQAIETNKQLQLVQQELENFKQANSNDPNWTSVHGFSVFAREHKINRSLKEWFRLFRKLGLCNADPWNTPTNKAISMGFLRNATRAVGDKYNKNTQRPQTVVFTSGMTGLFKYVKSALDNDPDM
jgi:prophage antirepressor-like protein